MSNFRQDFIRFAIQQNVLCFGEFQTKAGRLSPYFFNAGLFDDGAALRNLSQFYAQAILASEVPFDMLFGPAYKGIPLVAGTAIALAEQGTQRALLLQSQGSQGPRRRRDNGGRRTAGTGFDHR